MTMMRILVLLMVCLAVFVFSESEWEGKVIKGNRNALFLVKNGQRHLFPDFWTFSQMGFTTESIKKVSDTVLNTIPLGDKVEAIPMFRPDDFMYHTHCDDPDRMVNDLGIVANLGNLNRFGRMYQRVQATKKIDILLLGGSITAGGYFMEFFRLMEQKLGYNITFHNHGHGATEITCQFLFLSFVSVFFYAHDHLFLWLNRFDLLRRYGTVLTRFGSHRLRGQ